MQQENGPVNNFTNPGIEMPNKQSLTDANVLRQLPFAVYATDNAGVVTSYNEKATSLWGRTPETGEKIDQLWSNCRLLLPDGKRLIHIDQSLAAVLHEGDEGRPLEFLLEKENGKRILLKGNIISIKDEHGNVAGTITSFYESTVQIAAINGEMRLNDAQDSSGNKQKLKQSEERYHRMIEEVEDYAIVLLDEQGIIQNWNKGAEKIKGYREQDIVGKSFSEFYFEEDRQRKLPQMLLEEARKNGKAIHEGWRRRKDGSRFWGSIVITALHNSQNDIVGFSKVTRDLTERKAAEDRARENTIQLEFQNKELQQFAYAASHDMKEPLRKINFYNNFVLEKSYEVLDEKSREYLNRSVLAVKRMTTLIDDLLSYSQTSSHIESFKETDLNELVEEIILSHKDLVEEKLIGFEISSLPVLEAIPFQFRQLLDNLVNNSIKYKHPDRKLVIKITSDIVNGITIKSKETDPAVKYHKISVIDNGLGFDALYAEKIFEIFQRLTNLSGYKGSGIGLAICKKIVQNHRGAIKASGKENEGARFDVFIPVI